MAMQNEKQYGSLIKFNAFMGFLHLIQGLGMLILSVSVEKFAAFKVPVLSNFLTFDRTLMRLVTVPGKVADLPFTLLVSFFLFLSAIAHFIIVTVGRKKYVEDLAKGINRFRWYEYAISSSLMIVLIAVLFGIYDIGALIPIFLLNASMNLFGLLMEELNQFKKRTDWSPFVFGTVAGLGPWVVVLLYAFGNADPAKVPWFAYAIVGSYFLFFNLFPINMVLQYLKKGRWADYLYGERVYIILSLVAKTVLAWLVFAGVMQPK